MSGTIVGLCMCEVDHNTSLYLMVAQYDLTLHTNKLADVCMWSFEITMETVMQSTVPTPSPIRCHHKEQTG